MSLVPKERKFSILFQQGAENVVKMAKEFREIVHMWENVKERVSILDDLERDGDAITHSVMTLLNRSFIPPFDREDISLLVQSLDDISDNIYSSADMMLLFRIEHPTKKAAELSDIVLQISVEVEKAISGLSDHIDQNLILERCEEIHRLENQGDTIYRMAVAEVFTDSKDIYSVIKWREIYKCMESIIDGCEIIADVLENVVTKNT